MTTRPTSRLFAALSVLALVTLTACSGVDMGTSADEAAFSTTTAAGGFSGGESAAPTDATDTDGERAAVDQAAFQVSSVVRQVVFTAQMTVAVTDVEAAAAAAVAVVDGLGGFVFGEQTVALPQPRSVVTFKIAPELFQEALARLGEIGEVRSQDVRADDVTERIVDLQSRITTAEASVERLRDLISEAADVKTLVEIENQLLIRETELETMRGQLRTVQDAVALATISVTFTEALENPSFTLAVSAYRGHDDKGDSCPGTFGLTVDEGDDVTVCFEITNTGDTALTGLEIRDAVLDIELSDLTVVFGDPSGTMEPGQSVVLAAEVALERRLRTQTRVTALPVNADGVPLEARSLSQTESTFIDAVDPGGLPGFSETLSGALGALVAAGWVVVLALTAAAPFVWLPVAIWFGWRWWRRRRSNDEATTDPEPTPESTPEPAGKGL